MISLPELTVTASFKEGCSEIYGVFSDMEVVAAPWRRVMLRGRHGDKEFVIELMPELARDIASRLETAAVLAYPELPLLSK